MTANQANPNQLFTIPNQLLTIPNQLLTIPNQLLTIPNQLFTIPNQLFTIPNQLLTIPNGYLYFLLLFQRGDHPYGEQPADQLGHEDVLRVEGRPGQGPQYGPQ